MARSPPVSGSLPAPGEAFRSHSAQRLWDDGVLRIAFLTVGLLLAYQLAVILLQPAWIGPVTDWLLVLLAWSGLLGVVVLSVWLTRTGQPVALSWWLVSGGLLAHALAYTLWLMEDLFLFPHHAPFLPWTISSLPANICAFSWRSSCCRVSAQGFDGHVWRWMPVTWWVQRLPSPGTSCCPPST